MSTDSIFPPKLTKNPMWHFNPLFYYNNIHLWTYYEQAFHYGMSNDTIWDQHNSVQY